MQEETKRKIEEMIRETRKSIKRTTIILKKEERDFIDSLIREGKETGIKPLISKMLNIYKSMMIYDWHFPGDYYYGISRIAFVNVELLNILIQQIPKEKLGEIGKKMGEALKVTMETTLNVQTKERQSWEILFKRLRVQGFGEFYLKDKYVLIKNPFIIEPEIWAGIFEGLLEIKLGIKTSVPPFVLEINETQNSAAK